MEKKEYRSGFVALIGCPNAGKSTLLNALIGEKIAIISDKAQTTRHSIQGVLSRPDGQLVFVDTPGLHKPANRLGQYMIRMVQSALDGVDAVVYLVDAIKGIGRVDTEQFERMKRSGTPVILAINKMDALSRGRAVKLLGALQQQDWAAHIVPISAKQGDHIDLLVQLLFELMPPGPQYYPDEQTTDQSEQMRIAELIREQALNALREEVPHGVGVEIERFTLRENADILDIHAAIYCEKENHKAIIIGKGGAMLREIGTGARKAIEEMMGYKVYLELFVKVRQDWRNKESILKTLGYE